MKSSKIKAPKVIKNMMGGGNKEQTAQTKNKIVIDNYIDKVKPQDGPSVVNQKKPVAAVQKSQPVAYDDCEYGEYDDEYDDET